MKSSDIRNTFLDFFRNKNHTVRPSDSLIPSKDPTLLFTTAGMVQFKSLYAGAPLEFSRAATVQKCLRAGGKGSDLENVGITLRHHTFFEMLGNFSFGDYFKEEAILWAWEFLTEVMEFHPDQLWVSVYHNDDEAFQIWNQKAKVPVHKIVRLGDADNFWGPAGTTGACGPCSEIYVDLGPGRGCQQNACQPGCDCERYLEVWNLVFPQFYQEEDGSRGPLERRGIDTGMGLERLSFLSQKKDNNYQSDLFLPLIHDLEKLTDISYQENQKSAFHIVVDHIRALTFALSDGIVPSNEGRGYVLRRILRRAIRAAKKINLDEPFLYRLVPKVVSEYQFYENLTQRRDQVIQIIHSEEKKYFNTLRVGVGLLEDLISDHQQQNKKIVSGTEIFKLYDTYGFPSQVAEEILGDSDLSFDKKQFELLMNEQKTKAKKDWQGKNRGAEHQVYADLLAKVGQNQFLGYDVLESPAKVVGIIADGESQDSIENYLQPFELILDQTPFYGESGGQVGDQGIITIHGKSIQVLTTTIPIEGLISHRCQNITSRLQLQDLIHAQVDFNLRHATMKHHSATHLLNATLRSILGEHVEQAGSLVNAERLRFDFSHPDPISTAQLIKIEKTVNQLITQNIKVQTKELELNEAKQSGALAFFGDKYADVVRVVEMGEASKEFCGGTHVSSTGDIGLLKIIHEGSVASGVRRIEAVCSLEALNYLSSDFEIVKTLSQLLKVPKEELVSRVEELMLERKNQEKEIQKIKESQALEKLKAAINHAHEIQESKICVVDLGQLDQKLLKPLMENAKKNITNGVVLLGSRGESSVHFSMWASPESIQKGVHAGKMIQELAQMTGGGGGGKADSAQAGGKDISKLEQALDWGKNKVIQQLSSVSLKSSI